MLPSENTGKEEIFLDSAQYANADPDPDPGTGTMLKKCKKQNCVYY
jgi:hypothetical protein